MLSEIQRQCFDMCCVAHYAEDTPRRSSQGNDIAALQNEQAAYVPDENYRNL